MLRFFYLTLLITGTYACSEDKNLQEGKALTIAISKASGDPVYNNYIKWLKDADSKIVVIDLFQKELNTAKSLLETADGLILSGGPDPHPGRYGKTFDTNRCDIDLNRDTLEFGIYEFAKSKGIPILGVCRGMQVINVAEGGSLIVDIPSDYENAIPNLHQNGLPEDAMHKIAILDNTNLKRLTQLDTGVINCNHHQGIDRLASNLVPSTQAEDGQMESFELINKKNWIFAVQWHPERLKVEGLSKPIRNEFLKVAKQRNEILASSK